MRRTQVLAGRLHYHNQYGGSGASALEIIENYNNIIDDDETNSDVSIDLLMDQDRMEDEQQQILYDINGQYN